MRIGDKVKITAGVGISTVNYPRSGSVGVIAWEDRHYDWLVRFDDGKMEPFMERDLERVSDG